MTSPNTPGPERLPGRYTREQVIAEFSKFVERGVTHPDNLNLDDPEVIAAYAVLDNWGADIQPDEDGIDDAIKTLAANLGLAEVRLRRADVDLSNPQDYVKAVADELFGEDPSAERGALIDRAIQVLAAILEYSLERSTVLVDVFSDPDYLDEVANDWLAWNDLPAAQRAGLTEIAARIQAKIDEINLRLRAGNREE